MRHARSLVLLLALTLAGAARAESPGVETIVAKHLEALGGVEVLRATKSMKYTVTDAQKKVVKTVIRVRPNKMRVEVQEGDTLTVKGFDGAKGWIQKGTAAAELVPTDKLASMKQHAEFDDPLLDYATKGHRVKLIGTADVKGAPAYEIELTLAGGDAERRFIDAKSFLEVKRVISATYDGKTHKNVIYFGDYRKVSGQMVNHTVEFEHDGTTGKMVVGNISFDSRLDESLFTLPASTARKL